MRNLTPSRLRISATAATAFMGSPLLWGYEVRTRAMLPWPPGVKIHERQRDHLAAHPRAHRARAHHPPYARARHRLPGGIAAAERGRSRVVLERRLPRPGVPLDAPLHARARYLAGHRVAALVRERAHESLRQLRGSPRERRARRATRHHLGSG